LALSLRIQETLRSSPYRRLHLISPEVRDGVAILHGQVPNYHMKQVAQCLLAGLSGLERIDNRLKVAE
jgi:osmotically-inducible protein OsmY